MKNTGFATIGTSKITQKFLNAAKECEGFKLVAVYSREIKSRTICRGAGSRAVL